MDSGEVLFTNDEYDIKKVTEFEFVKGQVVIPECRKHLFMDELTDGQQIFPKLRTIK